MNAIAVRKARELDPSARQWMRTLFGRDLNDDESVTVLISVPHAAPTGAERETAAAQLREAIDVIARKTESVPEAELDYALDEALAEVRRWKN